MTVVRPPWQAQRRGVGLPVGHHPRAARRRARDLPGRARRPRWRSPRRPGPSSGLLRAATSSDEAWGGRTAVNLPALTVTVADMVAALERAAGPEAEHLIDWVPDPAVARIVTSWPARFRTDRAARLGLVPDPDFDSIIAMHLAENGRE